MSHMNKDINEIEALKARIKRLEQENAQLKALLYKTGTDGTASGRAIKRPEKRAIIPSAIISGGTVSVRKSPA